MCGGTCYWRDEARFLRVELDNESREQEETETYVAMLESQKAESDLCLEDVANQLVNAHEEIEKLRLELEIVTRSAHKQLLKNILNTAGKPDSQKTASLSFLTGLPIAAAVSY